jgi:hypothetical protein
VQSRSLNLNSTAFWITPHIPLRLAAEYQFEAFLEYVMKLSCFAAFFFQH